jgi:hypothetical protein
LQDSSRISVLRIRLFIETFILLGCLIIKSTYINNMDNKSKTGSPDRDRINVNEAYELQDWSDKFGVTPEELRRAVKSVGTSAKDVEKYLRK